MRRRNAGPTGHSSAHRLPSVSIRIEVEGESFDVAWRRQPDGSDSYDFTWLNGPDGSSYGFTVGIHSGGPRTVGMPSHREMSRSELEEEAAQFVRAFFAEDGIGPADFPGFVAARRG